MRKSYVETPLLASRNGIEGVLFKMDCYQSTGSFKVRGMDTLVRSHLQAGRRKFVASSGGNAGFSLAYVARRYGCEAVVVVPEGTPMRMQEMIRREGADLRVHGKIWNEADELARSLVVELNAVYVSPFDDPLLWEGHSTLVDEAVAECAMTGRSFPKEVVVAVGGGGMLCGVMQGLERHGLLDQVRVLAAETAGAASYALALREGRVAALDRIDTIAKSLGAKEVAEAAFQWSKKGRIDSFVITDAQALAACKAFEADFGVKVGPSCGAALAYVYGSDWQGGDVMVEVCGGLLWQ